MLRKGPGSRMTKAQAVHELRRVPELPQPRQADFGLCDQRPQAGGRKLQQEGGLTNPVQAVSASAGSNT
jgi:hypothetical protein